MKPRNTLIIIGLIKRLCTIIVPKEDVKKNLRECRRESGGVYWVARFRIVLLLGDTELSAQAVWEQDVRTVHPRCRID